MKLVSLFLFGVLIALASSHEVGVSADRDSVFKQGVQDLCSGHGLMHLSGDEIEKICDKLSENYGLIEEMQVSAKNDKFLSQLTRLIIWTGLPRRQKNQLLRKSYSLSTSPKGGESEWPETISLLIEETSVLDSDEINTHLSSSSEYLRAVAKMRLQKDRGKIIRGPRDSLDEEKVVETSLLERENAKKNNYRDSLVWVGVVLAIAVTTFVARRFV